MEFRELGISYPAPSSRRYRHTFSKTPIVEYDVGAWPTSLNQVFSSAGLVVCWQDYYALDLYADIFTSSKFAAVKAAQ